MHSKNSASFTCNHVAESGVGQTLDASAQDVQQGEGGVTVVGATGSDGCEERPTTESAAEAGK